MTLPGTSRAVRLLLALCGVLAVGAVTIGAAVAGAQLPTVPAPVGEAVGSPVGEVTKTVEEVAGTVVAPPVQEATEVVPKAPVAEATETVAPPVKEITETATKVTEEATHTAPPAAPSAPAVHAPAVTKPPAAPSVPAVHAPAVTKPKVTPVGNSGSGSNAGTTASGSAAAKVQSAPVASAPSEPVSSSPASAARAEGEGPVAEPSGDDRISKVPTEDGAVRAPVPKWVAYVWPAIALTWSHFQALPPQGRQTEARDSSATSAAVSAAGGDTPAQGVKGVHASGGIAAGHDNASSSSIFDKVPAAVGSFTSSVPGEALAYLVLVALVVGAVFVVVKIEIGRRGTGA